MVTHTDRALGYSVALPASYKKVITSVYGDYTYLRGISAEDLTENSKYRDGNSDYWMAAHNLAQSHCAADGPDGGTHCPEITRVRTFLTDNGLQARELYLLVNERRYNYETEQMEETSYESRPVYLIDISRPGYPFVIMVGYPLGNPLEQEECNLRIIHSIRKLATKDFVPKKPPQIEEWARLITMRKSGGKLWTPIQNMGIRLRVPPVYQLVESERAADIHDDARRIFLHMDAVYAPEFKISSAVPKEQKDVAFARHIIKSHYSIRSNNGKVIRPKIRKERRYTLPLENEPYVYMPLTRFLLEAPVEKAAGRIQWHATGPVFVIDPMMPHSFGIIAKPGSALESDKGVQTLWSLFNTIRPILPAHFRPDSQLNKRQIIWQKSRPEISGSISNVIEIPIR
ncbi:MAG: hypothetical protein Q9M29_05210 [Mariprofundaceae bacterium]|nr:hypothetical protein [Mariprofundaceae bacterium]